MRQLLAICLHLATVHRRRRHAEGIAKGAHSPRSITPGARKAIAVIGCPTIRMSREPDLEFNVYRRTVAKVVRSKAFLHGLLMLVGASLLGLLFILAYAPLLFLIWLINVVPWFYHVIIGG